MSDKTRIMTEKKLCYKIANFIQTTYPTIIFAINFVGIQDSRYQSGHAMPDLKIYEPSHNYVGMALEIKTNTSKICLVNGLYKKDKHTINQLYCLSLMAKKQWFTGFSCSYSQTVKLISWYLTGIV